jgi:hypothetical protein
MIQSDNSAELVPPRCVSMLRLLLGKGALRLARGIIARRSAEDEKWAAVTESADFDNASSNE